MCVCMCRSVLAECEALQRLSQSVLPGRSEARLRGSRRRQRSGLAVCGGPDQQKVHNTHAHTHAHRTITDDPCWSPTASPTSRWRMTATACRRTNQFASQDVRGGLRPPACPPAAYGHMTIKGSGGGEEKKKHFQCHFKARPPSHPATGLPYTHQQQQQQHRPTCSSGASALVTTQRHLPSGETLRDHTKEQ